MQDVKRTAVQTLRRDLNEEMVALSRVTRDSLAIFAARIVSLERWRTVLSISLVAMALGVFGLLAFRLL